MIYILSNNVNCDEDLLNVNVYIIEKSSVFFIRLDRLSRAESEKFVNCLRRINVRKRLIIMSELA